MKKVLFLIVAISVILAMGCDSDSSSSSASGSYSVGQFKDQPLYFAIYDSEDYGDFTLVLFSVDDMPKLSDNGNYVSFSIAINDMPENETTYTLATGLEFCEVAIDYNDDDLTGYAAEMDYEDDTDSYVTIRKSGDEYTIEFSVKVSESDSFTTFDTLTGSYTGSVVPF